jgi:two-component system sensor histidine kinase PilS (NtrC family)
MPAETPGKAGEPTPGEAGSSGGGRSGIAAAREEPVGAGLFTRLTYLSAFRLATVTALLGATTWLALRMDETFTGPVVALLYTIVAFVYAASLGYLWLLRRRRLLQPLAYAQIAGDLLVATFLVYVTGGVDSLFTLMYPLAIVNASVLLNRNGAIVAALGSALSFAGLSWMLSRGFLSPAAPYLEQHAVPASKLALIILANGTAFVLTAALASYLTEQLRTTGERLKEREVDYAALDELHASIVRGMSSGIVTTDLAGRITFLNPAAEEILGQSTDLLIDVPLQRHFPALAAAVEGALPKALRRGEVDVRDARGEMRRLGYVVNPLTVQGGRRRGRRRASEPGLAILLEDLTPLREMQDAIRRKDRLAAVGQLAAGLAHELRNPLASMSGAAELLSRGTGLSSSERRLMEIVMRETERLNALVTDFLAFARPTPIVLQPVDVAALADETLGVFRHSPASLHVELLRSGASTLRVYADPSQLRQVLWNLLQNAAEAMQQEGHITVDVGWTQSGLCRLAVADSGPGIDFGDMEHLFEPFFTTKPQGTGLGLAFVHRIVEAHGGRVDVQSEAGQGATFAVLLPVTGLAEATTEPPAARAVESDRLPRRNAAPRA